MRNPWMIVAVAAIGGWLVSATLFGWSFLGQRCAYTELADVKKQIAALRVEIERLQNEQAPSARPPNAESFQSTDDILQAAQDAYVRGQYGEAIRLADRVTDKSPTKAWRIVGASKCFLKESPTVAYDNLDPQGRQFLKYVCSRNAVQIGQ